MHLESVTSLYAKFGVPAVLPIQHFDLQNQMSCCLAPQYLIQMVIIGHRAVVFSVLL